VRHSLLDGLADGVERVLARIVVDSATDGASAHPTLEGAVEAIDGAVAALRVPLETYERTYNAAPPAERTQHEPRRRALLQAATRAIDTHALLLAHAEHKRDAVRERLADLGRSSAGAMAYAYATQAVRSSPR
jgi:hypothetical protein